MYSYTKPLITGALLGSTLAIGLYVASAAPGRTGMPEEGLISNLMGRIVDPTDNRRVQDANNLGNIPSASWQRDVTGFCRTGTWAVGVDDNNAIICRDW